MNSFPQASPPPPCAHLYTPPYAPHALPISFISILPPAQYWVRSTDQVPSNMSLFRLRLRDTSSRNTPPLPPEIRVGE
jgi:hypothetical protein